MMIGPTTREGREIPTLKMVKLPVIAKSDEIEIHIATIGEKSAVRSGGTSVETSPNDATTMRMAIVSTSIDTVTGSDLLVLPGRAAARLPDTVLIKAFNLP